MHKYKISIYSLLIPILGLLFWTGCSNKTTGPSSTANMKKSKDFRAQAPAPGPSPVIDMGESHQFTLDNGLRVIVVENHKIPKVSMSLILDEDPILEGEKAGVSEMTGELIMSGTKKRSKSNLDKEIDFIGANISSSQSGIFASSLSKHTPTVAGLMSEVLLTPSFPPNEFEKVKKQYISKLESEKSNPSAIAGNVSDVVNFGKSHPYGEFLTMTSLNNIALEDVISYYNTYWKPNVSYLAIVGDISVSDAKDLVNEYFSSWSKGDMQFHEYADPRPLTRDEVAFVDVPGAVQSTIQVTYPVRLKPNDPDRIAATVMNSILGGGVFSGYLMQNLREDKGYTYGARSYLQADKFIGSFGAYASVRNEVTDSAIHEILFEMNRLRTENVDADHLQLVKNSMIGSFARSMESPQSLASKIINITRYNLPEDYYSNYIERINSVTIEDIARVAKKYLHPDRAHILVVGNKEVAPTLAKFGEITYYNFEGDIVGDPKSSAMPLPSDATAVGIIGDYLEAQGGIQLMNNLNTLHRVESAEIQGQEMRMEYWFKQNKAKQSVSIMGMTIQEQSSIDGKLKMHSQGQDIPIPEKQQEAMKVTLRPFPELALVQQKEKWSVDGITEIEGTKVFELTYSDQDFYMKYYIDLNTKLLQRRIISSEGQNMTFDYADYRSVDGFMFPFQTTLSGVMPTPLVSKVSSIEVNKTVEDAVFN